MSLTILNNESKKTCSECGGECCKRAPGQYVPEDFGIKTGEPASRASLAKIRAGLVSGAFIAHSVSSKNVFVFPGLFGRRPRIMILRPRRQGEAAEEMFALSGGWDQSPCNNWSRARGCGLVFDSRPWACRALRAGTKDGVPNCKIPGELYEFCIAEGVPLSSVHEVLVRWRPYQRQLKRLVAQARASKRGDQGEPLDN